MQLYRERSSQRIFNKDPLPGGWLDNVLRTVQSTPSSCARYAIKLKPVSDRDTKQLLGGILVGGAGWVHRADTILLLCSDDEAYVEKLDYMKYVDAGFVGMSIMLTLESMNIGGCYINPNIREDHRYIMFNLISHHTFCGAIAVGNYNEKAEPSELPKIDTLLL